MESTPEWLDTWSGCKSISMLPCGHLTQTETGSVSGHMINIPSTSYTVKVLVQYMKYCLLVLHLSAQVTSCSVKSTHLQMKLHVCDELKDHGKILLKLINSLISFEQSKRAACVFSCVSSVD